jgi:hypothetical protein
MLKKTQNKSTALANPYHNVILSHTQILNTQDTFQKI